MSKPDRVYYNIQLNNPVNSGNAIACTFNEVRRSPIIDKCDDYYFSVLRANIPSAGVPLYYYKTLGFPATTNVNTGVYSLSLGYNGGFSPEVFLTLIPENNRTPRITTFSASLPNQEALDEYYFMFSYQNLCDMVNVALATAFAGLPAPPAGMTQAPYMIYDANNGLFSLLGQQAMFNSRSPTDPLNVGIFFNTELQNFFRGFQEFFLGYNMPSGRDTQILIKNNLNNSPTTQSGFNPNIPAGFYQIQSEFFSDFLIESTARILFVSNSMPVLPEVESSSNGVSLGGSYLPIIFDLVPTVSENNGDYREAFQYFVNSEFKRADMISSNPLTNIQLQVYSQAKDGVIYPILIQPGETFSCKIMFERKAVAVRR